MGEFVGKLEVEEAGPFAVRLTKSLKYRLGDTLQVRVPAGFVSDYATIPRFLWSAFPPHGYVKKAAVIHDYLYTREDVPRVIADAVFLAAMRDCGVSAWSRALMYGAVRCFGWLFWCRGKTE